MAGRILIADDVATNRIILKVKLTAACYDVRQVRDVAETLRVARTGRPDLIVLDRGLRGGGAVYACAQLKADPRCAMIPVVIVTAQEDRGVRLEGYRAGADAVLVKPLEESALLALVRSLMRTRATHDELLRRQSIAEDLGFGERPAAFTRPARVALIAPGPQQGVAWRGALARVLTGNIAVMSKAQALDQVAAPEDAPDAFVIAASLAELGDGLRLVSELRSRPATRHAAILVQIGGGDATGTAMALDLGANAVMTGDFDAEELAERLRGLIRRKQETDALRQSYDQRLDLALRDPLTGLYNRRYAQTYLSRIADQASAARQPFALMLLDLDRFKEVNDRHGHLAGDEVLIEVARRLRHHVREIDLLARIGGEEFVIALPETGRDAARVAAERLRQVVGETPVLSASRGLHIPVTMSIGVAIGGTDGAEGPPVSALLDSADRALYAAKADGRNQVTFVRPAAA